MPPSLSTFLSYIDTNSTVSDSKVFMHQIGDFLGLKFPELEFCIIQHLHAPECYLSDFAKEHDIKYVDLLKKESHKRFSKYGDFYVSGGLFIFPITDYTNQVKFVILIDSCPDNMVDELSVIVREVKEVFRFVSAQIEENSRSINLKMANLVSQISHDLNSLIALIPEESAKEKALNARIKYSEIMSREILYYLRELSINKSRVPVRELFSGITSVISFPENVDFNLKFINEFDYLTVDVELIDRALSAIVMNAVIATSIEGGEVKMTVDKRKNVLPLIEIDWLEIIITDTGPGIAKEFLNVVRNPFFTTWKDQGHVGLGLSIADKIIQAHDGYLDIKSTQEKGAMVTIHLPLC